MTLLTFASSFICKTLPRLAIFRSSSRSPAPRFVRCTASDNSKDQAVTRRSANYHPAIWQHDFLQSLENSSHRGLGQERVDEVKEQVKNMLRVAEASRIDQLELIDLLQRLGVSHHFEEDIERILKRIFMDNSYGSTMGGDSGAMDDLHATSLEFRLLRQRGFDVPQEVFESFRDETGSFKASLQDNVEALLSLYEASYLSRKGEMIMSEAADFTRKHLMHFVEYNSEDDSEKRYLRAMASRALELPYHWSMRRPETRWFIDVYQTKPDVNPVLLELAVLDFNMIQAVHQEDLRHASAWWMHTDFSNQLTFSRDRIAEKFLGSVGLIYEPEFKYFRRTLTKIFALILTIDDIYDVYGTMEELQLFTEAVERWDVNKLEDLPEYIRLCFLLLYNVTNEIGFDILRDQRINVIPYLQKAWEDMCKSFMVEARWSQSGYKPSLREYMENAWVSSAVPVVLINAYCVLTPKISRDSLNLLPNHPLVRSSALLFRLANDLATSSREIKGGDVPKAVQCFMHETGASEEEGCQHVWQMIRDTWEGVNEDKMASGSLFSDRFWEVAANLARSALSMYRFGDVLGSSNIETKNRVSSVLVHPIQLCAEGLAHNQNC